MNHVPDRQELVNLIADLDSENILRILEYAERLLENEDVE